MVQKHPIYIVLPTWVWVNTYRYILVGWTSIYQLFWGSLGTRVLTHLPTLKKWMLNGESLNGFGQSEVSLGDFPDFWPTWESACGGGVRHVSSGKSGNQSWEGILQVWFKHLNSSNSINITCNMQYIIIYLICVQHVHPIHFSGWSFIDDLDIIRSYVKLPEGPNGELSIFVVIYWRLWHAWAWHFQLAKDTAQALYMYVYIYTYIYIHIYNIYSTTYIVIYIVQYIYIYIYITVYTCT